MLLNTTFCIRGKLIKLITFISLIDRSIVDMLCCNRFQWWVLDIASCVHT